MNKLCFSGLVLLFMTSEASAMPGFYLSAHAGATMLRSTGNTLQGKAIIGGLQNSLERTPLGTLSQSRFTPSLAVGYDFNDLWQQPVRLELAFSRGGRVSGVQSTTGNVVSSWSGTSGLTGYRQTFTGSIYRRQKTELNTVMINGYYDYHSELPITPWLMAGVGMGFIHSSMSAGGSGQGVSLDSEQVSQSVSRMAWATGAGVTWNMTSSLAMDAGYRFTNSGEVNFSGTGSSGILSGSGETRTRLQQHTVELGLRYTF